MHTFNLVLYGIGRARSDRRKHYIRLAEALNNDFKLNKIEILNDIGSIENPRSGEFSTNLNKLPLLSDSEHIVRDFRSDKVVRQFLKQASNFEDCHQDAFKSTNNLLQQLAMLNESLKYIKDGLVLAIRDDLLFDDQKLMVAIKNIQDAIIRNDNTFATSFFHSNRGICERLYFGSSSSALNALSRIELVPNYLENINKFSYINNKGLNGEFLMRYAAQFYGQKILCFPLFTKRLRFNSIQKEKIVSSPVHWQYELESFRGLLRYWRIACSNHAS